jgi:hypothetical protein
MAAHLEVMADRTLQIYEELKAQRESEMSKFIAAHDAWRDKMDNLEKGEKPPREPIYRGPTEWELSLAEKRVSVRKWQLELRHAKFQRTRSRRISAFRFCRRSTSATRARPKKQ